MELAEYLVPAPSASVYQPPKYGLSAGQVGSGSFPIFLPYISYLDVSDTDPSPASKDIVQYLKFSGSMY